MGSNPIQNPGYFPGTAANDAENDQLNQLDQSETQAYAPPSPTPSSDDGGYLPADANVFDAVSSQYQNQVDQGNVGDDSGGGDGGDDGGDS